LVSFAKKSLKCSVVISPSKNKRLTNQSVFYEGD